MFSSRASYEMVQKSVACGIELLVAISAATDLAVNMAEQHNLSLIGFARPGKANIYAGKRAVGFSLVLSIETSAVKNTMIFNRTFFIPFILLAIYPLRVLQKPNVGRGVYPS